MSSFIILSISSHPSTIYSLINRMMRCGISVIKYIFRSPPPPSVCYQPTELIWALFFVSYIFQFYPPPPLSRWLLVFVIACFFFFVWSIRSLGLWLVLLRQYSSRFTHPPPQTPTLTRPMLNVLLPATPRTAAITARVVTQWRSRPIRSSTVGGGGVFCKKAMRNKKYVSNWPSRYNVVNNHIRDTYFHTPACGCGCGCRCCWIPFCCCFACPGMRTVPSILGYFSRAL